MKATIAEIPKLVIGGVITALIGLFVLSVTTMYRSYEHLRLSGNEYVAKGETTQTEIGLLGEFLNTTSPMLERSTDRCLQLQKLTGYTRQDVMDQNTRDSWHKVSASARLAAAQDVSGLDRYSETTVALSTPIKTGLQNLLNAEISLWQKVDIYVEAKSSTTRDERREEEVFQSFIAALLDYTKSINSVGSLNKQTADRVVLSKQELQARFQRETEDLRSTGRQFKWAIAGAITTFIMLTGLVVVSVLTSQSGPKEPTESTSAKVGKKKLKNARVIRKRISREAVNRK